MTSTKSVPQQKDRRAVKPSMPFNKFLLQTSAPVRRLYFLVVTAWTAIYGLPLVVGVVIARLIDRSTTRIVDTTTWWLLAIAVGLMALRALVLWGGLQLTFVLIFKTSTRLKMQALRSLLGGPVVRDGDLSNGEIINRLRNDTDEIGGLLEWTTDVIYRSVLVVIAVGILGYTDIFMTIPLILLTGGLFVSIYLKNKVAALQSQIRLEQSRVGGAIADTLNGIRDLRLSGAVTGRVHRLEHSFESRRHLQQRHQVFSDLLSDLFRNLVLVGIGVVLLTASWRIAANEFTIGNLILFITYSSWLGQQMSFFGKLFARYQGGKVSYQRLVEMISGRESAHVSNEIGAEPLRELTAQGLTRSTLEYGPVPEPVSFAIRPGQLVAITGPVGAGKSTVVRALLGLQRNALGRIAWNGTPIADDTRLRAPLVGYARQSAVFLPGTVRENLRLGDESITDDTMNRALTAVHLRAGSPEFHDGLDTYIGSGQASQLSGGQRQRLALARMLCHPAQILVVDDCDSSLDSVTASDIWDTIIRDWPAAWVVVSHNADLLARADSIVRVNRAHRTDGPYTSLESS